MGYEGKMQKNFFNSERISLSENESKNWIILEITENNENNENHEACNRLQK